MKKREVELIEERMKQSTHHVKAEELQAHENEIGIDRVTFRKNFTFNMKMIIQT